MNKNLALWTIALSMSGFFAAVAQVQVAEVGTGSPLLSSGSASATTVDKAKLLAITSADRVEGKENAPVTIIEYASMTCSHCRDFNNDTLPKIEQEWIETGKAKYVLRHLPWDNLALAEALVMHCAPESSYYPLAKAFFGAQEAIVKASDPLVEVKQIARFAGLDDATVQACITNPDGHDQITVMRTTAQKDLGITGTPTFFINGEQVDGFQKYDQILPKLQAAYKKATGK